MDKELGVACYSQHQPLNCFFSTEYGRHIAVREKLAEIVAAVFPSLSPVDSVQVQLPGIVAKYPNPLREYRHVLDKTLEGRRSYVHGDLHLRNVLVDESGVGRLTDFAKVTEWHNLFDFIKLKTYIRQMAPAYDDVAFGLDDYVHFEEALNDAALKQVVERLDNAHLNKAYQVIRAIREIARKYMGAQPDLRKEYFPALLLYCLESIHP